MEVRTDGGIRIYDDSLTRPSQDSGLLLGEYDLLVTCHQLMALAAEVGDRSGYRGSWNLGVAASGLQGARSAIIARHYGDQGPQFDDPEYRATAEVAHADLNGKPAGLRRSTGWGVAPPSAPESNLLHTSRTYRRLPTDIALRESRAQQYCRTSRKSVGSQPHHDRPASPR